VDLSDYAQLLLFYIYLTLPVLLKLRACCVLKCSATTLDAPGPHYSDVKFSI
jgi:hypothetical protein